MAKAIVSYGSAATCSGRSDIRTSRSTRSTVDGGAHQEVLNAPVHNLLSLLETAHEPLPRSLTLFDLGQHDLEEQTQSSGLRIPYLGDLVSRPTDLEELSGGNCARRFKMSFS